MKKLLILLVLVSSAVFAVSPNLAQDVTAGSSSSISAFSPMNPDVLWEVPYDPDNFDTGYLLRSPFFSTDDIIPDGGWSNWGMSELTIYVVAYSTPYAYRPIVWLFEDGSGAPGDLLDTFYPTMSVVETGDTFYGENVYAITFYMDHVYWFTVNGIPHWLTANPDYGYESWYWLNSKADPTQGERAHRTSNDCYSWTPADASCDLMMLVDGPMVSIDETSWGAIKAAF